MSADLLRPFLDHPERSGIFLDFDGTLSEIVHVPSDARPVEGARDLLAGLARRYAVVAIVSGRSAHELLEWLGPEVEIWGVHGAQRTAAGKVELSPAAAPFEELMRTVHDEAAARVEALGLDGVIVEDKGVMVGLHFRNAVDGERARRELDDLATELVQRHGLTRAGGRLAYELRPPVELSKAAVVAERARGLEAVAFAGDDRVDLPGFDALDVLAKEGVATLRLAVNSNEAPPELIERADVVVDGPLGALDFLRQLVPD
ncbi:MAG TPA: trehalose-phosphatase [Actinomycetota bacterium]|nr:trehalose-phosphatase [Actinomycetota bacterium]